MQKYRSKAWLEEVDRNGMSTGHINVATVGRDVYLASDVDARIAELEQQLAGANATIARFMGPDGEQHIDRFAEAVKSLMAR